MSSHHRILGVPTNATIRQIKQAYFQKAKKLHPDVNKSPNAMEEFVRLNMAYEALTNPSYIHPPIYVRKKNRKSKAELKREWVKKRNEELRQRAIKVANAKRKQRARLSRKYQTGAGTPIFTLVISGILLIPTGINIISVYDPNKENPHAEAVLIGGVLLALGIFLSGSVFLFLYRKFFK